MKNLFLCVSVVGLLCINSLVSMGEVGKAALSKEQRTAQNTALKLVKAFKGLGADTKLSADSYQKSGGKATVKVTTSYYDKKEDTGIECYYMVTLEDPSDSNAGRENGSALIEGGMCAD